MARQTMSIEQLLKLAEQDNLVKWLGDTRVDTLKPDAIASRALDEYNIDKTSRANWEVTTEKAIELAMLVGGEKNTPHPNSANIKYPLLTTAALQFNARTYPAIVQGRDIVRCRTWGEDPNGQKATTGDRVSEVLNYQLADEMPEWEGDTDWMTLALPIVGCMFRKVYYDPARGRTATKMLLPTDLVVNYRASSLVDVPRYTEPFMLYPNEIEERIRSEQFIKFDYKINLDGDDDENLLQGDEAKQSTNDTLAPQLFLEQHTLLDLDEDGLAEPYIVTIHKATQKCVRIKANFDESTIHVYRDDDGSEQISSIKRIDFYVKYEFLPSPDGGFYGWGLGMLLKDVSESINSTLNMIMDAGSLSNTQGGLVSSSLGIREKNITLKRGEWQTLRTSGPIRDAVFPIKYDPPSPVLFNLLGTLIEAGKDIAGIKDVLTGEVRQNMTASATLALIEQGMQVYTSIFKRIHRALKTELKLHVELNKKYMTAQRYNAILDGEQPYDPKADFEMMAKDIQPVSDPRVSSRMQDLAKAEFIMQLSKENPLIDPLEATKRILEAGQIDNIESLLVQPPQPDPMQDAIAKAFAKLELENLAADKTLKLTNAIKNIAQAQGEEQKRQLDEFKAMTDLFVTQGTEQNEQRGLPILEGQPSHTMGNQGTPNMEQFAGIDVEGDPFQPSDPTGRGMV